MDDKNAKKIARNAILKIASSIQDQKGEEKTKAFEFGLAAYEIWTQTRWNQYTRADRFRIVYANIAPKDKRLQQIYFDRFVWDAEFGVSDLIHDCWDTDPNGRPTFETILQKLRS